jgi:hypothetical protein
MYKFVCEQKECPNKNIIYYILEKTEKVMCGGCKTYNFAIEVSQYEFDQIFDYDPYTQSTIGIE